MVLLFSVCGLLLVVGVFMYIFVLFHIRAANVK